MKVVNITNGKVLCEKQHPMPVMFVEIQQKQIKSYCADGIIRTFDFQLQKVSEEKGGFKNSPKEI